MTMLTGAVEIGGDWYLWGDGTAGGPLVLEDTGVTLDGLTLWRIVAGTSTDVAALIDDATGDILVDDATGQILHEG